MAKDIKRLVDDLAAFKYNLDEKHKLVKSRFESFKNKIKTQFDGLVIGVSRDLFHVELRHDDTIDIEVYTEPPSKHVDIPRRSHNIRLHIDDVSDAKHKSRFVTRLNYCPFGDILASDTYGITYVSIVASISENLKRIDEYVNTSKTYRELITIRREYASIKMKYEACLAKVKELEYKDACKKFNELIEVGSVIDINPHFTGNKKRIVKVVGKKRVYFDGDYGYTNREEVVNKLVSGEYRLSEVV